MAYEISCTNPDCSENGLPKQMDDEYLADLDAGLVMCGGCQQPIDKTSAETA